VWTHKLTVRIIQKKDESLTLRSLFIGLLLAFGISVFTYFNDHVIRQTYLIGNHFPVAVFGPLIALLLLLNPVLRRLGLKNVLSGKEIAVIGAMGLVVCGWPGSGFFRTFSAAVSQPVTIARTNTAWKATHVMSYAPSVSPLVPRGHINDYNGLAQEMVKGKDSTAAPYLRHVWEQVPAYTYSNITRVAQTGEVRGEDERLIISGLNACITNPGFYQEDIFASLSGDRMAHVRERFGADTVLSDHQVQGLNRMIIERVFQGLIMEQPRGDGFLLANGDLSSPAVQKLQSGAEEQVGVGDIPWKTWMPTLRLWGGLALLLGLASLCIIVIVQPQWKQELIPYPIARVVQDMSVPDPEGRPLPAVACKQLFWVGLGLVFMVHLFNGLSAWDLSFINIPLQLPLGGLSELFPEAMKFAWGYFTITSPTVYFTVIAFAFFLATEVSFSVGISGVLFLVLFVFMQNNGVLLKAASFIDAKNTGMMRFGSYLGIALMVFFVGRRYYLNVIASAIGIPRYKETPANAMWAMRILIVCVAAAVMLLASIGLDWVLGLMLVLLMLLMFLVMARINVETGTFFIQPIWGVVGVILVFFGIEAIGPTAYIIMAFAATLFAVDPRTCLMPFVANGMFMVTERDKKQVPSRFSLITAVVIVGGFLLAMLATFYLQYNNGLDTHDRWAIVGIPAMPFKLLQTHISELLAYGQLNSSLHIRNLELFANMGPDWGMVGWIVFGLTLVLVCGFLRLRISWWPLHPVVFLVWGTMPGMRFAFSFLVGWLIKFAIMRFSGIKGYNAAKPLMFGLIAGELLAALTWILVGAIYYAVTGLIPETYTVFPL
jgi:hypothetical protein